MVGNPRAVKLLDRALQQWSIRKAATYLKTGDPVLDVGCADGTLFRQIHGLGESVGMDRDLELDHTPEVPKFVLSEGYFHKLCSLTSGPG